MVAMNVWPTDAADGSVASEARWRKMARQWAPTAVLSGVGSAFACSLAFPNMTVQPGAAWVDGHYCELLSPQVLTVTANGLSVIRFDPAANTAELLYRDGVTDPAQSPTGVYEVPITQLVGSTMVDRRPLWQSGITKLLKGNAYSATPHPGVAQAQVNLNGMRVDWVVEAGHSYLVISTCTYNVDAGGIVVQRNIAGNGTFGVAQLTIQPSSWGTVNNLGLYNGPAGPNFIQVTAQVSAGFATANDRSLMIFDLT